MVYWVVVSTYPSEKYVRQLGVGIILFPTEWKVKKHVPNHQPAMNIPLPEA
jgi:hypothetical protein